MKYLKIKNIGQLEIKLVALLGGTTKAKDKFKIGQFGTGLKYTLAYLFRNNLDFKIFIGEEEVKVHIEKEEIRGECFEIICINGQRTSITTHFGDDFKAWMIVRELYTNALDEGGAVKDEVTENLIGEEGKTTFYIQISSDIQQVLDEWDKYFMPSNVTPIFQNESYILYPPSDHLCIYKHGVLIYENEAVKSVFRYDILFAAINELRQYMTSPSCDISTAIKQLNSTSIEYFLENVTDEHYEGNNMDYNWFTKWGESWETFVMGTKLMNRSIRERFSDSGYSYREKDYTILPTCLYNSLTETLDIRDSFDTRENRYNFYAVESQDSEDKLYECIGQLANCGYEVDLSLKFLFGLFNEKSKLLELDRKSKKLLISPMFFQKPITEILALLVEKNEQFKGKIETTDDTKKHFINLYMQEIYARNKIEA